MTKQTKSSNRCWTCKDRKIRCDGTLPACDNCTRTSRKCDGYGVRLSWPKDNDKKRAVVGIIPKTKNRELTRRFINHGNFINTSLDDIELYYRLYMHGHSPSHLAQPFLSMRKQPQTNEEHAGLLEYFYLYGYESLVTFDGRSAKIRDLLLRMSRDHHNPSGQATFYALVAFSCLHRYGANETAMKFKVAALKSLSISAQTLPSSVSVDILQHIAACMLLCAFEIIQPSSGSGEWLWYVAGALNAIQSAGLDKSLPHQDGVDDLIDWFHYHYTLSRFSARHWNHKVANREDASTGSHSSRCPWLGDKPKPKIFSRNPTHEILNLLSETCEIVLSPEDPRCQDRVYQNQIDELEQRMRSLPISSLEFSHTNSIPHTADQIFQISGLIYLTRSAQTHWQLCPRIDEMVDIAFAGPVQSPSCGHFFPLLILACEARTDERRAAMLRCIDGSSKNKARRGLPWLRKRLQNIWVQQDLHADSDILESYSDLLNTVSSSSTSIPSYA